MNMIKYIIVFLTASMLLFGCGGGDEAAEGDNGKDKLNIVATTGMIADAARNVGGEQVMVNGLMGPGVDPHLYKASEGDVTRMSNADLIFYNGLHLEGAMSEVLEQMSGRIQTFAVSEGIDKGILLSSADYKGAHDPHIWFDVTLWMKAVEGIRDMLKKIDPDKAEIYENNARAYLAKLDSLHQYVKSQAEIIPQQQRVLITAHDAFSYFGRAYGFEVKGLQGISTVSEAGTADVKDLAEYIVNNKIPAIFIESSVPKRNIEAVQAAVKSRGFEVKIGGELYSDAMGTRGTPEGTYLGMVRHNINTIVEALLAE